MRKQKLGLDFLSLSSSGAMEVMLNLLVLMKIVED
jgi:hypothetical protein